MKLFVKRVISVALAACMAIGSAAALNAEKIGDLTASFAVKAAAATIVDSGECGDNVTYTLDSDGLLTISGVGSMYDYDYSITVVTSDAVVTTAPWERKSFSKVVISNGVTNIGECAFVFSSNLTSVTIPDSVTSIGNSAFFRCSSLTSITIPDGVTDICNAAFSDCRSLASITIPYSVTSIGRSAFDDVPNIVYSGNLSGSPWGARSLNGYIEDGLVYEDSSKTKLLACPSSREGTVVIPNSVTSIGDNAFYDCRSLTSITIPDSVTSIGDGAFSYCTGLTSIAIPDSVTSIGSYAFYMVPNIVYSGAASGSPWKARALNGYIEDGIVYEDSSKTKLLACPSSREGTVVIPDSVTSIGDFAFDGCTGLTSITIPDSVTSIGDGAFSYCTGLTSITIPDSVTSIDDGAFAGCTGLTSITIPGSVTSIDDYTFLSCRSLTGVILPDSVTNIGEYAFSDCTGLTSITIPDSVTSIGEWTFYNCTDLTSITIGNSVTSIGYSAFRGCTGLTSITIPDSVTSIDVRAFEDCSGLTSITIPDSVTSLDGSAFSGCSSLTSVTIGSCVTSIGSHAFSECSSLTSITIPSGVTNIGYRAFSDCYKLTEVYILNPDCITEESSDYIFSYTATIYSHAGYGVEKYADKYGYSFVPIHINENTATAKCTEEVTEAKCKYCDEMTLPVRIHDFTAENTDEKYLCEAATCYRPASYYVSCKDCGLSSKDLPSEKTFDYGEAVEHKGKWVVSYPATCTSTGYENEYCIYCDCYLGGRTIPTIDHIGGDPVEENITATCTDPGTCDSVVYCVVCGEELSRTLKELPALGHNIVKYDAEDATCTTPGHESYEACTRCEYSTYEETTPALGHIEEVIPAVAANCVHMGLTEGKKCIRCKEILVKQQEIAKTAHTWDNGTVTREPQVGVAGERTFTCTVCSATRTEGIAPLVPSAPDRIEVKSSDSTKELTDGIVGATHSVTVSELLASSNASFVVDKNGNRITETATPLATGMKIILESGGERLEKVISVLGDVNGDGEVSVSDARGALRAAVGLDTLEGAYLNAARVNGSNEVAVSDARSILRAAVALDTGKDWLANIK